MPRLAVYDSKNKTRLLGFIADVPNIAGPLLHLSVCREVDLFAPLGSQSLKSLSEAAAVRRVSFSKEWVNRSAEQENTWYYRTFSREEELVLTTDASLADLIDVPSFELPDRVDDDLQRYEEDLKESAFGLY